MQYVGNTYWLVSVCYRVELVLLDQVVGFLIGVVTFSVLEIYLGLHTWPSGRFCSCEPW